MKKILKNKFVQSFLGWLISIYIKVCFHTSIWIVKNSYEVDKQIKKKIASLFVFGITDC